MDHSHEVLGEIEQVRIGALRAATWLRGYGMYPSAEMLLRIKTSAASATRAAVRLQALTVDNPEQNARAKVMLAELDKVLSIYAASADIARQQGPAVLWEMTIAQLWHDIGAELRETLEQLEETEQGLLATRHAVEQQRLDMTERLVALSGVAFIAAMLWTMHYSGQLVRLGQQEVEQLHDAALLDPLTGLLNRRGLQEQLAKMNMQSAVVANVAVLAFDLDNFKPVNDRYSHAAGDLVLKAIAQRLQQQLRSGDAIARVGGDEFVAVLPSVASRQEAVAIAQRICLRLGHPIPLAENSGVCIGASVGVAMLHQDGKDIDTLLHAADKRMYMAKGAGKGQVEAGAVAPADASLCRSGFASG
ncbi:GGDEF domain-containing protein [Azohydromonas australica]|uniref:GGDEF domain-containing protein n=1 Tax=Azohydromonas australica TaxID=364039 RepID=UPI000409128E|nr:diguanylate cyclase [Azohydromonas australica]